MYQMRNGECEMENIRWRKAGSSVLFFENFFYNDLKKIIFISINKLDIINIFDKCDPCMP